MSFFKKKSDKEDRDSEWKPVIIEREGRFHMLCYRYTVERLLPKVRNLFRGDNLSRLVNSYLRKMEPMLVHHMNLEPMQWEFSLKWGNEPKEFEYIYDKIIPLPNYIATHMLRSKDAPPEMISEYAGDYIHKEIKYYHPPPEQPQK